MSSALNDFKLLTFKTLECYSCNRMRFYTCPKPGLISLFYMRKPLLADAIIHPEVRGVMHKTHEIIFLLKSSKQ